jgi:hypothetical protein
MKPAILALFILCSLCLETQAQIWKKVLSKDSENKTESATPANQLYISGDPLVEIDSSYEFDWAIYQESEKFQGSSWIVQGGDDIVIYYSSKQPIFSIQLQSRSTGTRYHFYGDFTKKSQLMLSGVHGVATGEKTSLQLDGMEPVYPGEIGYLSQLKKTGAKKIIAGIVCEYVASNNAIDASIRQSYQQQVTAWVWVPMTPHTVFPAYGMLEPEFKNEIEAMLRGGSYPPVIMPLEMYLEYSNGDKIFTYTTHIITHENRRIDLRDINKRP